MATTAPEPMLALPSAERPSQKNLFSVGVILAGAGGLMAVGALLAAWLNLSHYDKPWPPQGVTLSNYSGTMLLLTLLMSAATVEWGVWSARRNLRKQAVTAHLMTIALGLAFLNLLWFFGRRLGFGVNASPFAVLFYSMLAIVGIAVAVGVGVVIAMTGRVLGHQALGADVESARAGAWMWQAVVVGWLVLYYKVWIAK